MTLKQYINGLQKFVEENPDALGMEVVTSIDDEGNGHNPVYYSPQSGILEDRTFTPSDVIELYGKDESEINAVCVN